MIKKILGLLLVFQAVATMSAATFSSELGVMVMVGWHYDVYEDKNDQGMEYVGAEGYDSATLQDGAEGTVMDGYYFVDSGMGWTRYYWATLVIDYEQRVDMWQDFEEDIPNTTVHGDWTPSEDNYYTDEWVNQNRTVQKRVRKGKRYNGYEKDVTEETVYDYEFRTVPGTMQRP